MSPSNAQKRASGAILDKQPNVTRNDAARKKPDKRAQRTRLRLETALHELLSDQDYDAITVDEICARGAIGRSTFYTHFKNKDDLKRSAIDHLHAELQCAQSAGSSHQPFAFSRALFKHAKEHVRDYQVLGRGRGSRVVLAKIKQIVTQVVSEEISKLSDRGPCDAHDAIMELETAYVAGALMSLLTRWLSHGAQTDVAVIDRVFVEMTRAALTKRTTSERSSTHRSHTG
jgi:AcrR family transcriptional regulator